ADFPALIPLCYDIEHPDNGSRTLNKNGDFSVTLEDGTEARFLIKDGGDIKQIATTDRGGWIDDDGSGGRPTHIGHIQLSTSLNSLDPVEDGFYPIGPDRSITNTTFGDNDGSA